MSMKGLVITLLGTLMFFSNCATKRKTKEVERIDLVTENQLKNDSIASATFKINKNKSELSVIEFESVLKALNVQYDGEQGNDLKVSLNRTENGTELNVSGKGKANYNEATENTRSLTRNEVASIFDSIIDARVDQYKSERSKQLLDTFKKETENETTGFQFGAYLTGFGVICVILLLGWVYLYLKKV